MHAQPVVSIIEGRGRQFGPPPADIITQQELDYAINIRNRIDGLLQTLNEFEAGLLARRQAGARVEAGPHVAQLKRQARGRSYIERIVIK